MNSLLEDYRAAHPDDQRGDDEITGVLGQWNDLDGRYNNRTDFVQDYNRIKANQALQSQPTPPPQPSEFSKGLSAGTRSLESTAVGLGALGADAVGAMGVKEALVNKFRDIEDKSAEENAPAIGKIEDIHSVSDALKYLGYQAGAFVPNLAETAAIGAAGGAVGGAEAGPVGAEAGATTGVLEGLFARQAAKSALKYVIENGAERIPNTEVRSLVKQQLQNIVARKAIEEPINYTTKYYLETEAKAVAKKFGLKSAEFANFASMGAGSAYGQAENTPGVSEDDAKVSAVVSALGNSLGALLPNFAFEKAFPGLNDKPAKEYVARLAINAAQQIPMAASGMGLMEVANIAAEKYSDPKKRDSGFTDEDLSRILNATAVGGLMGTVSAPVSAIPGPRKFSPIIEQHMENVSAARRLQLDDVLRRQRDGTATPSDEAVMRTLSPDEHAYVAVTKPEISKEAPTKASSTVDQTVQSNNNTAAGGTMQPSAAPSAEPEPTSTTTSAAARAAANVPSVDPNDAKHKDAVAAVKAAEANVNTEPSLAQKDNLKPGDKPQVDGEAVGVPGHKIALEVPAGGERSNVGADGKPWSVQMPNTYGEWVGTKGKDGDPIDVHIGPSPTAPTVFVLDQMDPKTGAFDEHKTFVGFGSKEQVRVAYEAGFSDGSGKSRIGAITAMSKEDFAKWLKDDEATKKPVGFKGSNEKTVAYYANLNNAEFALQHKALGTGVLAEQQRLAKQHPEAEIKEAREAARGEVKALKKKMSATTDKAAKEKLLNEINRAATRSQFFDETLKEKALAEKGGGHTKVSVELTEPKPEPKKEEKPNAEGVRSDTGQSSETRNEPKEGEGNRGGNVEQAPSGQPQPVEPRKEEAPKAPERLTHDKVDVENRPTFHTSARGTGEEQTLYPAWAVPRDKASPGAIATMALSEHSPNDKNLPNTWTRRSLAVLDRKDGTVHNLSAYENNGKAMVTLPDKGLSKRSNQKGVALDQVLKAKTEDGFDRYKVLGSALSPGDAPHQYLHDVYPDRDAFEREFQRPLEARQAEAQSKAEVVEAKMAKPEAKPKEVALEEEHHEEATTGPAVTEEPEPLGLKPDEVTRLRAAFKGADQKGGEHTLEEIAQSIATGAIDKDLRALLEKVGLADPNFFGRVADNGIDKALEAHGYKSDAGKSGQVEPGGQAGATPDIQNGPGQRAAEGEVGWGENPPGQPGQAGGAGNEEPNQTPSGSAGEARPPAAKGEPGGQVEQGRRPTVPTAEHDPESARLVTAIHNAAARAGIDVVKMAGELGRAAYRKLGRVFLHVLGEHLGPADVVTAFHEVAHDVFENETPEKQERLLAGISTVPDDALGLMDPKSLEGLGERRTNVEKLMEVTALSLQRQGFDPDQANTFAQRFVRRFKDLSYQATDLIRKVTGWDPNPDSARRYLENRVKMLLAGDRISEPYLDFVGARKLIPGEKQHLWYPTTKDLAERMTDGGLAYDHQPDISTANSMFNLDSSQWQFRVPANPADIPTRRYEIEKRAAGLNHMLDIIARGGKEMFKSEKLQAVAKKYKMTAEQFFRTVTGIPDPEVAKKLLGNARETDGSPVQFNPDSKVEDFTSRANRASVDHDAYVNAQGALSKAESSKSKALEHIQALQRRAEEAAKEYAKHKNYKDIEGQGTTALQEMRKQVRSLFSKIYGTARKEGAIEQQLRALDPKVVEAKHFEDYGKTFEGLFNGDLLKGQKLEDVLDTLANDPKIDFSKPITEVRDAIKAQADTNPAYAEMAKDSKAGNALLATVAAFAKTHERQMAELELRRSKLGKVREAVENQLSGLENSKKEFMGKVQAVTKSTKLEARLQVAHEKALREKRNIKNSIDWAKTKVEALDAALPGLHEEVAKRGAKIEVSPEVTWGHGMPYNVPESDNATTKDIAKNVKKLQLDSTGKVTNPAELAEHLRKMQDFIYERERQASAGKEDALDAGYQAVKRQYQELIAKKNFQVKVAPHDRFLAELSLMPAFRRVSEAVGTAAARMFNQMGNAYTTHIEALHNEGERIWQHTFKGEDALLRLAPKMSRDYLRREVLNPVKRLLQNQHDLEERYAGDESQMRRQLWLRVKENLSSRSTKDYIGDNMDKFVVALRSLSDDHEQANLYHLSKVESMGVKDPKLRVFNPATGEMEQGALRRHAPKGAYTFSQKLGPGFGTMAKSLGESDWESMKDLLAPQGEEGDSKLVEAFREDPESAKDMVRGMFNNGEHADQVQDKFFRALAESPDSNFPSPLASDGITSAPADPYLVQQAFNSTGGGSDPIEFARELWRLHDGEGDEGQYVGQVMQALNDRYEDVRKMWDRVEPTGGNKPTGLEGMAPSALIDARSIEHLPGQWFDYHSYDEKDVALTNQRIAAEKAFGRNQDSLKNMMLTVRHEVGSARDRLSRVTEELKTRDPNLSGKALTKALKDKLGDDYDKVTKQAKAQSLLNMSERAISDYFRKDNQPQGTLNAWVRGASLLGALLVEQPASAINMLSNLTYFQQAYGISPSALRASLYSAKATGRGLVNSFTNALGFQLLKESDYDTRYRRLGLNDPASVRDWHIAFDPIQGESKVSRFFRGLNYSLGVGLNRRGAEAGDVILRPLKPFTTMAVALDKGVTEGMWQFVDNEVRRGVEYYMENRDKLQDPGFKLSPDELGLKGPARDSHVRLSADMDQWNLNYDDMVRGAIKRGDGKGMTDDEALKVYAMGLATVSKESSLSTTPTYFYNNPVIRFISPLLRWSFVQGQSVLGTRLDENGQTSMRALAYGMGGLAAASLGGLGVSALVNQYYEDAVGKKRNLRPIVGAPDAKELALGIMENLNRTGTFGILGELANGALNVGTGEDNRILSLDQRVVALSAFATVQQAISSAINQGTVDYAHVVRPLIASMGGNGALQYMQVANNVLGMDNTESRMTARINAQNWLRVAGRQAELDVRSDTGAGASSPTPMAPMMTKMELAAYGDNPADFDQAYRDAVAQAKAQGFDDPVDHVKKAFALRNPLRSVFKTPPSEKEYKDLINGMPTSGASDVQDAVDQFNKYSERIGIQSFEGSKKKKASF